MTRPGVVLGQPVGPFHAALDRESLHRFADATNDPSPAVRAGAVVPPVAVTMLAWEPQHASQAALVPADLRMAASGGVHGEHDVVLHRPIVPGEELRTWVEGVGARPAGRNSLVTLRYSTFDVHHELVAEQWWTTVWLGVACDPIGVQRTRSTRASDRDPSAARTWSTDVDVGMARRYAEASGDRSAHHFDLEAARASGFDRLFVHGLCTMALCARAVAELVAGGDPQLVRRVAVRFASPTYLGERLDVRVYDAGARSYTFDAVSAGEAVITNGRAELR